MRPFRHELKLDKGQFKLFSRFVRFILPYRAKWIGILVLSGLVSLLGLVNPYLTKLVIDRAMGNKDLKVFIILAIIGGAVFIVTGAANALKQYLERYIKVRVKFDLNKEVFSCISGLSYRWFQNRSTGENIYKVSYDIGRVQDLITTVPPQAVAFFPKIIFILIIILRLNWKMAMLSMCLAPFLYLPPYYFMKKRRAVWEALIKNSEQIFKALHETFSHIYPIKVFGKEAVKIKEYLKKLMDNVGIELKSTKLEIFNSFSASLIQKLIIGLITFYGGYQVIKGTMTLGSLTAIMVYLGQLIAMQSSFIMFFQTTVLGLVSCQRVAGVLDEEDRIVECKDARDFLFKEGGIVFDKVGFGYSFDNPILKDLSFSIEGARHVSLVAPSGTGKTTLLNLIVRLYDPWQGDILIDGVNIKELRLLSLKQQIAVALQEPYLFNDTLRNNILYGKEDASEQDIIEAARLSLAHDFIKVLPDKYETVIGENACKLSEGQKQKIAIARVLIKKPKILILDEAMSSMDSVSEERILQNIKENMKAATIISVSHRLSTVKAGGRVYFLKNVDQIITGSYEEMLTSDKDFRDLFHAQMVSDKAP